MNALAQSVLLAWGWPRRAIAVGAGALSALAMPPFFAFPVLWLTFPVLVWLLDGAVETRRDGRLRRALPAFRTGWLFGFGYFLAGLWWVGAAFLVEAESYGWLLPFAVLALPAGLALFWGLAAALAQAMWSEDWRRIFALAAGLGAAEWLRGHVLTGFPWNAIGYALTGGEVLMQSAALFGVEGLSFIAVAVFAAPAVLVPSGAGGRRNVLVPALAAACVAGLATFGLLRLGAAEERFQPGLAVRIVQPNIDQSAKWEPENRETVVKTYLDLSAPGGRLPTEGTLLVWPETALPFALAEEPGVLAAIGALLPPGSALATGAFRVDDFGGERRAANTLHLIDDTGTIQDSYDKVHLVPFGEYLPLQKLVDRLGFPGIAQFGFSAGPRRRMLTLPFGPPFAPLICYEIIFPGAALPEGPRPGFLLNVTNDGWFGRTTGPYQHYHQARVRGVEEGLPVVRAANTGISAVTDAYGRVVVRSGLGVPATLDAALPAGIGEDPFGLVRRLSPVLFLSVCLIFRLARHRARDQVLR